MDLAEKLKLASTYVNEFPKGRHVDEAKTEIERCGKLLADQEADRQLIEWERRIGKSRENVPELLGILKEITARVYSDGDGPRAKRRDALAAECRGHVATNNWTGVLNLLNADDLAWAARKWAQLAGEDADWAKHTPELIGKIRGNVDAKIDEHIGKGDFDEAERRLAGARDALAVLEGPVKEHAPDQAAPLSDALTALGPAGPTHARIRQAVAAKHWAEVADFLKTGDVARAAGKWARLAGEDADWAKHTPELIGKIRGNVDAKIDEHIGKGDFDEAERRLAGARDALAVLEGPVKEHAPDQAAPLSDALTALGSAGPTRGRIRRAVAEKHWTEVKDVLKDDDVREAVKNWVGVAGDEGVWATHTPELIATIRESVEKEVNGLIRREEFDEAARRLDETLEILRTLERPVREHAPDQAAPLSVALIALGPAGPTRVHVIREKDRTLYENFLKAPSSDLARDYLERVSEGVMREDVKAYIDYLKSLETVKAIGVEVSILWDKNFDGGSGHVLELWVEGHSQFKVDGLTSTPGTKSPPVKIFRIPEQVQGVNPIEFGPRGYSFANRVFVVRVSKPSWFPFVGPTVMGDGTSTLQLAKLEGEHGENIRITNKDNGMHVGLANLKIVSGVPQRPELPPWKDPSSSR